MRATVVGTVVMVKLSDDEKFADVVLLQDGASQTVQTWAFADALIGTPEELQGKTVSLDVWTQMKVSKAGNRYLNTQTKGMALVDAGAGRKLKTA